MSDEARGGTDPAAASRRGYVTAVALLAVGAGLLLLASGRVWVTATVTDPGLPSLHVDLSGRDLQPEGAAVALVALAGVAGVVATRRVGRLVSGAVLLVSGLAAAVRAVEFGVSHGSRPGYGDTVASLVSERTGVALPPLTTAASPWWLVSLVGGLLVAAGGATVLARSRTWPVLGGRYERDGAEPARARREPRPESAWDRLDRGEDPTTDVDPAPGGRSPALEGDAPHDVGATPDPSVGRDPDA